MSLSRRKLVISGLTVGAGAWLGQKTYELGAPPEGPKACSFSLSGPPAAGTRVITPPFPLLQAGGTIDDASCLDRTAIAGIVAPGSTDELAAILAYARSQKLGVTAAGARHSMGGQSFSRDGLVIDMRHFSQMTLDPVDKVLTVGSGATWDAVLPFLDARGLSPKAMQSISIFSIGGSISVNAHGVAHSPGSLASTVRSMRVMLADGTVVNATPTENSEVFRCLIGGYGLLGIILDARLDVTDNALYLPNTTYMDYREFPAYFSSRIAGNRSIGLMYGRLSVSPSSWLRETVVHTFQVIGTAKDCPPLSLDSHVRLERTVFNLSKTGPLGRWVRWQAEKRLGDLLQCHTRNKAIGDDPACTTSRNDEMDDTMAYLQNRLEDTDILQEYFVPRDRFTEFVDGLRAIVARERVNLLNVTIRGVDRDSISALPYATQDSFAIVLYFNQRLTAKACESMRRANSSLIDLALRVGGRFYLPYQLYYSAEQLNAAYPEFRAFLEVKRRYDPTGLFLNAFYTKYASDLSSQGAP
jgi:FAD/FMN-containing dehydrogenase